MAMDEVRTGRARAGRAPDASALSGPHAAATPIAVTGGCGQADSARLADVDDLHFFTSLLPLGEEGSELRRSPDRAGRAAASMGAHNSSRSHTKSDQSQALIHHLALADCPTLIGLRSKLSLAESRQAAE